MNADSISGDTADPYNLQRFLDAQCGVYDLVERELRSGRKESHWTWFIFPQIPRLQPAKRVGLRQYLPQRQRMGGYRCGHEHFSSFWSYC